MHSVLKEEKATVNNALAFKVSDLWTNTIKCVCLDKYVALVIFSQSCKLQLYL